jgi:hypothetical protein
MCLDSFAPFSEPKGIRQLAHRKNAFAMIQLYLPFGHSVQQTEIIQLGGFSLTLLLVSTDATVEVISIYASLASSALGHRGLQHFHRSTGFARFCGYFQINRDNLNGCDRS